MTWIWPVTERKMDLFDDKISIITKSEHLREVQLCSPQGLALKTQLKTKAQMTSAINHLCDWDMLPVSVSGGAWRTAPSLK